MTNKGLLLCAQSMFLPPDNDSWNIVLVLPSHDSNRAELLSLAYLTYYSGGKQIEAKALFLGRKMQSVHGCEISKHKDRQGDP